MGIFSRIFRPSVHDSQIIKSAEDQLEAAVTKMIGGKASPPSRGTEALINMYNKSPDLRRVVHRISDAVASARWHVGYVKNKSTGRAIKAPYLLHESGGAYLKAITSAQEAGDLVEVLDHPMLELLYAGNAKLDGHTVRAVTNTYLDLSGEGFWMLQANAAGVPEAAWPMPPTWVRKTPTNNEPYYELKTRTGSYKVQQEAILWFRDVNPLNPYGRGAGTGESLADELDTSEYAATLLKAAFFNRGVPSGIISIKGGTKPIIEQLQNSMDQKHRGPLKFNRPHITNGEMDYKRIQQDFEELQVLPLRADIRDVVQQTFGVPPEIVGNVQNSNRASIVNAIYIMAQFVTLPRLERDQRMYQRDIAPLYDDRLLIWYDSPVPEDKDRQDEAAKAAPWSLTRNEWRAKSGHEDDPAGDVYKIPVNLITEKQGEEPKPVDLPDEKAKAKSVTKSDADAVNFVVDALNYERLTDEALPVWNDQLQAWGNSTLAGLGVDASFSMLNTAVVEHLKEFAGDKIKDLVNETTKDHLRESLIEGIRAGEGHRELRERVRAVFLEGNMDIYTVRANRIARTEAGRSANFTTWQAQKQSGVVHKRGWLAAFINTRPEHAELHARSPIGIDEPFTINGLSAMYPGGFNDGYMNINCQCTTFSVIEDPKSADEQEVLWRSYVRELVPWRVAAEAAFIRGFEKQLDDVLEAFDKVMP